MSLSSLLVDDGATWKNLFLNHLEVITQTVKGLFTILGNLTVGGTIASGNQTITGNVIISGDQTVGGNLAGGDINVNNVICLDVTCGSINAGGDLSTTGDVNCRQMDTTGDCSMGGDLDVVGALNGITIPVTGGTLAKLTDIATEYLNAFGTTSSVYAVNTVIPITTQGVANGMSLGTGGTLNNVLLPAGSSNAYSVSVTILLGSVSDFVLVDGNNGTISGTSVYVPVGSPLATWTVIIETPALNMFTLRTGPTYGATVPSTDDFHISVVRIK